VSLEQPAKSEHRGRDLTRDERAELQTARVIRRMMNTDGWKVYKTILETHLQGKRNEYEAPVEAGPHSGDGIAQLLRSESAKGAIMGLRLALSIPDGIIANEKILRGQLGLALEEDEE